MIENNYAFIDSQNLHLAIRDQGWRLDYARFRVYLKEKYNITHAFMFIGFMYKNSALYVRLQQSGFILIFKSILQFVRNGKVIVKGNVDAELVLHTMIQYPNYNRALIISGDGDFYCLVDHLNKENKLLKLLVPNSHKYSSLLKGFTPNRLDFMNNLRNKLEYKNPLKADSRAREPIT